MKTLWTIFEVGIPVCAFFELLHRLEQIRRILRNIEINLSIKNNEHE
jgi:hypothetical protein